MNIYSNAFNFTSNLSGEVDLRTGLYNSIVQLIRIMPEGPVEVSRDLTLAFSMMNQADEGYGFGWKLNNSIFDPRNNTLRLLSGERFNTETIPPVGFNLFIKDHKLKDIIVKRINTLTLHVVYIDGTIEVLKQLHQGGDYIISQIIFENGERFNFNYTSGGLLHNIVNAQNNKLLLELIYNNGRLAAFNSTLDSGRTSQTYIFYSNELLTRITIPIDSAIPPNNPLNLPSYLYYYQSFPNGIQAINRVQTPMGGQEIISYTQNGHSFANGQFIPYVSIWERVPGLGQPSIIHRYTYSQTHNFTGFPFTAGFRPGEDNLHLLAGEYNYWVREDTVGKNNIILQWQELHYNKFHLLTKHLVVRDESRITKFIEYNEIPGVLFINQPPNLQVPRKITTLYDMINNSASRIIDRVTESDEFGNIILEINEAGIKHEYTYFPVEGEIGSCPPEPNKVFRRYLRQMRIIPRNMSDTPKSTEYTYTELPTIGADSFYVVRLSHTVDGASTSMSYINNIDTPETHGRLSTSITNLVGATTTNFTYEIQGDAIIELRRITGIDGSWIDSGRTLSLVNRKVLAIQKESGVVINFSYDILGRIIKETVSSETLHEASRSYNYENDNLHASISIKDAIGGEYISHYDGFGRQVNLAEIINGNARKLKSIKYNELGELSDEITIDHIDNNELHLQTHHFYNGWGEHSRTKNPDGSIFISDHDLINNVRVEGIEGGVLSETFFNDLSLPDHVDNVSNEGERIRKVTYHYDGFGRLISEVDSSNNIKNHTYDKFDRVVRTSTQPIDATIPRIIETDYVMYSSEKLATEKRVNGKILARRYYDGVGRLVEEVRGNQEPLSWIYLQGTNFPLKTRTPRGFTRDYTYNLSIGKIKTISSSSSTICEYFYNETSSKLVRSIKQGVIRDLEYDHYGNIIRDRQSVNGVITDATYQYSPGGRLLSFKLIGGRSETRRYDIFGRLSSVFTSGVTQSFSYDHLGRLHVLTVTDGDKKLITEIDYDTFSRESLRKVEFNGLVVQTFMNSYDKNGLLSIRKTLGENDILLSTENYDYDAYKRLINYECSGELFPKDENGRFIRLQKFDFDEVDNITKVVTAFTDNETNTEERYFLNTDPCQLTKVINSNPYEVIDIGYDASGNMISNKSRKICYDIFERIAQITNKSGKDICNYKYDAEGRLVYQQKETEIFPVVYNYSDNEIIGVTKGNECLHYIRENQNVFMTIDNQMIKTFNILDLSASVRAACEGSTCNKYNYTPYGYTKFNEDANSTVENHRPAFNGQRIDPFTGFYHLGNGKRSYDPKMMVFTSPDPLSPFGAGGINSYSYCQGDPINLVDPTGLMPSWLAWLLGISSLIIGVITFGAAVAPLIAGGVAAATASAVLGAVSSGFGVVSGVLGVAATGVQTVDEKYGWDRSSIVSNLNIASFAFGVASMAAGLASAGLQARDTYRLARTRVELYNNSDFPALTETRGNPNYWHFRMEFVPSANRTKQAWLGSIRETVGNLTIGSGTIPVGAANTAMSVISAVDFSLAVYWIVQGSIDLSSTLDVSANSGSNVNVTTPIQESMYDVLTSSRVFKNDFGSHENRIRSSALDDLI
jgi:RHS repeat-associated protein